MKVGPHTEEYIRYISKRVALELEYQKLVGEAEASNRAYDLRLRDHYLIRDEHERSYPHASYVAMAKEIEELNETI